MSKDALTVVLKRQGSQQQVQQARKELVKQSERFLSTVPRVALPRQTKDKIIPLIPSLSGFASALIEITCTYPAESAKTMQQLNRNNPNFSVMKHFQQNGIRGMYNGSSALFIGAPIQGLIRFSALDYFNSKLADPKTGQISVAAGLAGGVASGILESVIVVAPMETIKTRLIESKKGLADGLRYVVRKEGFGGLYKGLSPTIAKSASNQGLRFVIFNQYKNMMLENPTEQKLTPLQALGGGLLAGGLGCIGNTPFDTVKSRMQGFEAGRYRGLGHCFVSMVREEGPLSLYKGFWARLARVLPGQGIIFMSYNTISNSLKTGLQ